MKRKSWLLSVLADAALLPFQLHAAEPLQGAGGATFQFQVNNSTGYDAYEPNDALRHATPLNGNLQINANLDTVSDFDYYTVTVPANQTATSITFNGTGTQTAQWLSTPTTWGTLPPGTATPVTAPAGATLLMRVYDTGATAPAAQAYALRVGDALSTAGVYQFLDTESITHLVPNRVNVARTIDVGVGTWDHTGNVRQPPGERVTVQASEQDGITGNWRVLATTTAYTVANGQVLVPLKVGDCVAAGATTKAFSTRPVPSDRWRIDYNPSAKVEVTTESGNKTNSSTVNFMHICREHYLGRGR
jgi:hypothetical protein